MRRRELLTAAIMSPLALGQSKGSLRDRLVGSWKLLSWKETDPKTGAVSYPCGKKVSGRIIYTPGGQMSAQILNQDRPKTGPPPATRTSSQYTTGWADSLSLADAHQLLGCYVAYNGDYTINETKSTVTHTVLGELRPFSMTIPRTRTVVFLTTDNIILSYQAEGGKNQLTWERERG